MRYQSYEIGGYVSVKENDHLCYPCNFVLKFEDS